MVAFARPCCCWCHVRILCISFSDHTHKHYVVCEHVVFECSSAPPKMHRGRAEIMRATSTLHISWFANVHRNKCGVKRKRSKNLFIFRKFPVFITNGLLVFCLRVWHIPTNSSSGEADDRSRRLHSIAKCQWNSQHISPHRARVLWRMRIFVSMGFESITYELWPCVALQVVPGGLFESGRPINVHSNIVYDE